MSLVLPEPEGTITVTQSALAGLVIQAAEAVDGVQVHRGRRRLDIDIDVTLGEARVRLELAARYGLVLPEVAREVQERVADALATMCAVRIGSVDVSVEEVE
jgi:uncharacterized alkaline shock family protein YloU